MLFGVCAVFPPVHTTSAAEFLVRVAAVSAFAVGHFPGCTSTFCSIQLDDKHKSRSFLCVEVRRRRR